MCNDYATEQVSHPVGYYIGYDTSKHTICLQLTPPSQTNYLDMSLFNIHKPTTRCYGLMPYQVIINNRKPKRTSSKSSIFLFLLWRSALKGMTIESQVMLEKQLPKTVISPSWPM